MFTKGVWNTAKTILIFFLVVAMVVPQTTWAVAKDNEERVVQRESELSQGEDLFNLTIKQEILGVENPSEVAFVFVVETKDGEEYRPYAEQPYTLFADEEDQVGEEKLTDEEGKITLRDTQRITILQLAEKDKIKVTEDISGEDFAYIVESKFNDADKKKSNEVEEVIGGKDVIVFTNEHVKPVANEVAPVITPSEVPTPAATSTITTPTPPREEAGVAKIETGWITSGKHTYYLNKKGQKVTGWQKIGDYQFYFDKTRSTKGQMFTGWQVIDKKTYYFEATGEAGVRGGMKMGWAAVGKSNFYFSKKNGELISGGWRKLGKNWFYLKPNGAHGVKGRASVGWKVIDGETYYFKNAGKPGTKGRMFTGIKTINKKSFYFGGREDGSLKTGWQTIKKKKYYFRPNGAIGVKGSALTSWRKVRGKIYYFSSSNKKSERGRMLTGWQEIDGHRYLLNSTGQPRLGWQKINKKWYYFNAKGALGTLGRLNVGWSTVDGKTYYFKNSGGAGVRGRMFSGIATIKGNKYYFGAKGDGSLKTGWQTINKAKYYFKPSGKTNGSRGQMVLGWHTIGGSEYYFYHSSGGMAKNVTIEGVYIGKDGKAVKGGAAVVVGGSGEKTIKAFLQNAMKPVGTTLYIWGGGHDAWSKGGDGVRAGVNPNWQKFYNSQSSSYNYDAHRFKHGNGLDCSGFIGWAAYNAIESKSNVMATGAATTSTSTGMPAKYASNGWGKTNSTSAGKFTPGDVVSRSGHVWIVLGQCSDGSVVLIHSTPQAGVQIAGSPTPEGSSDSQAVKLAQTYMKKYYPNVVKKFKLSSTVSRSYLAPINRFRWDVSGKKLMKDPEGYLKKTPAQILKDIFKEQ